MGLSFGVKRITPSSLSTGHPIHNRTIESNTLLLSNARRRRTRMAQDNCFVRVGPERRTKWHRLRANLMNYYRTQCSFGQAETFIGSDHRDLFARRLGDDLRVLVLWGGRLMREAYSF
jgi:hypothetical protein